MIDRLIENKQNFMQELLKMDKLTEQLQEILTPEQSAKFLVIAERVSYLNWPLKFKTKDELSISQLWDLPKSEEQELNPAFQNQKIAEMVQNASIFK